MRIILLAACALALGGCNYVYSDKPLFSSADSRGAPKLRPGIWMKPEKDCAFEPSGPAKAWPKCAMAMRVLPDRLQSLNDSEKALPYLIAAGDPPILQIPIGDNPGEGAYVYAGLGVTKRDSQGRVTQFVSWMAQCGPPPPDPDTSSRHARRVTEHLLPGLKIDKNGEACVATDPGAVRTSAKASEAWNDDKGLASWVRDGEN
jgi:hypothetical protein